MLLTISTSVRGSISLPLSGIMYRAWAGIDLIFHGMKSDFRVLDDGFAEEVLKTEIFGLSGTGRESRRKKPRSIARNLVLSYTQSISSP